MFPNNPKSWLSHLKKRYDYRKEYIKWKIRGKPLPPPHLMKQMVVRKYRKKSGFDILIESGTYLGEMVEAQRKHFNKIVSIELSQTLFEYASNRFRGYKNIEILLGDSGELIRNILANLDRSAIFWLDGHYSGGNTAQGKTETPILDELVSILESKIEHIILIDDARLFSGNDDYPTIEYLTGFAGKAGYCLIEEDDIIRLTKLNNANEYRKKGEIVA